MSDGELTELRQRYLRAAHAMQTGVKLILDHGKTDGEPETSPKHLRVGINSAMADHGGLAYLLVQKGVITEEEYFTAMAESMEREVKSYEQRVEAILGRKVTLG